MVVEIRKDVDRRVLEHHRPIEHQHQGKGQGQQALAQAGLDDGFELGRPPSADLRQQGGTERDNPIAGRQAGRDHRPRGIEHLHLARAEALGRCMHPDHVLVGSAWPGRFRRG